MSCFWLLRLDSKADDTGGMGKAGLASLIEYRAAFPLESTFMLDAVSMDGDMQKDESILHSNLMYLFLEAD